MRERLNALRLVAGTEYSSKQQLNERTVRSFFEVDVRPLEELIKNETQKEHDQQLLQKKQLHQQALKQAREESEQKTLKNLPFFKRKPAIAFGCGVVLGSLSTGLVAWQCLRKSKESTVTPS